MILRLWTKGEDDFLRQYYPNSGALYCSVELNRTVNAVKSRVKKLKIRVTTERLQRSREENRKVRKDLWSSEEVAWLVSNYSQYGTSKSAKYLRKSRESVKTKAHRLGLEVTSDTFKKIRNQTILPNQYTSDECDFLIENYPYKGARWCSEKLDRPLNSVQTKVWELGLVVDKALLRERRSRIISQLILQGKCVSNHPRGLSGKYFSTKLKEYITYRSLWEKKYFIYLDSNPDILSYDVEPFKIPYVYKGIEKNYIPDLLIRYKCGKKYILEIKPTRWLNTDITQAKATAGRKYAEERGMVYKIVTEVDFAFTERRCGDGVA